MRRETIMYINRAYRHRVACSGKDGSVKCWEGGGCRAARQEGTNNIHASLMQASLQDESYIHAYMYMRQQGCAEVGGRWRLIC